MSDKKEWIKINKKKTNLPDDSNNNDFYLFIDWHRRWNTTITDFYEKWENIKNFREHQLKNNYTHYMKINTPKP